MKSFDSVRELIEHQFKDTEWIADSGLCEAELFCGYEKLTKELADAPKSIIKARTFEYLVTNDRIAVDRDDIFQDKLQHFGIMSKQTSKWYNEVVAEYFAKEKAHMKKADLKSGGAYSGDSVALVGFKLRGNTEEAHAN